LAGPSKLNIGGETGFLSIEVEKEALLPLSDQHRPSRPIHGARYALKRLVSVKASTRTDIYAKPMMLKMAGMNGSP
jgi:hypothetical protein